MFLSVLFVLVCGNITRSSVPLSRSEHRTEQSAQHGDCRAKSEGGKQLIAREHDRVEYGTELRNEHRCRKCSHGYGDREQQLYIAQQVDPENGLPLRLALENVYEL